ncbi:MAG: hypothetical protein UX02_C0006G0016 [Candidatus Moranbacteria bacterium GW2011_GWC1_45_18]|nr:MAG: hypothetical protein UW19_C0016G0016 [Candidatus Moranbacteria bacterium GW2011_GWF2_44_10]KKT99137.1 MAG: hypothetical protein UX02_C0006G0016 [Candidatus Moranbacteria bacterium GW2011_GWC1_45_18]
MPEADQPLAEKMTMQKNFELKSLNSKGTLTF